MPQNKGQDVVFTLIMVIVMVYAMICYNISLGMGGMNNQVFFIAFEELVIMGPVAFILEFFFVGKFVKNMVFHFMEPGKDKPFFITLAISAVTVAVMCPLMSFVATLLYKDAGSQVISVWLQTTAMNFPMAFFWQIFYAGPFVRRIFGLLFKKQLQEHIVEAQ